MGTFPANRPRQRRPDAKAADCTRAGKQRCGTRAHLREASRTAAGRRHLPAPRRGEPNRPNSGRKSPAHTSARRANGKQAPAAQTRPGQAQKQQAAHKPGTRQRSTGRKHAKAPGAKANRPDSGRLRKSGCPGRRRGTPGAEKPLRTGKIRVRSFACPEGPCEPGPPKNRFAVFGWHGLFLLRNARSAEQKGAPPPFIPRSLLKKAGENFHVGPILAGLAISPQVKYHKRDFFRIGRGNGTWAGMQ